MRKRISAILLLLCLVFTSVPSAKADEDWYTYTYNFWKDEAASPDAYSVEQVLYGRSFGDEVGVFWNPESLFEIDDLLYVVDSKNNRIVELQWKNGEFELVRVIYNVQVANDKKDIMRCGENDEITLSFLQPGDIFVKEMDRETRIKVYGSYIGELYVPEEEPEENGETESTGTTEDNSGSTSDGEDAKEGDDAVGAEPTETTGETTTPATTTPAKAKKPQNIVKKTLYKDYDIFIADTQNHRIIHCDYNLNVIGVLDNPQDETLAENYEFLPARFIVDEANRYYVQATNINAGLMEFTKDGTFNGYIGASPVTISFIQRIWRRIQSKEQRARTKQYVPTEYNNITMDSKGFLYVTTNSLTDREIAEGTGKPIRKLNAMGTDILIRNGNAYPIGDLKTGTGTSITGASEFVDVVTFENETYACLDNKRGRIFVYDFQGNMLYAFGNTGMHEGSFQNPSAIVKLDEQTLAVLDRFCGTITIFTMTNYGKLVNEALSLYRIGHYDESADIWQEVLKYNGNCELAYVGIGRALLRKGEYKEAMKNFEIVRDSQNYSKAFKYYREQVVEENIVWFIIVLAVLIVLPKLIRKIIRLRKEINEA
ncbi:MAG: hypothetical protein J6S78_07860 [Lachnospiraceae bacterium]|nr:hypothetical protein [Lachnospiraceae bacterium]